jgi:hypothetical protein
LDQLTVDLKELICRLNRVRSLLGSRRSKAGLASVTTRQGLYANEFRALNFLKNRLSNPITDIHDKVFIAGVIKIDSDLPSVASINSTRGVQYRDAVLCCQA